MNPISVLLVDDNPTFLRIATRFLQERDDVVVVSTALGAKTSGPTSEYSEEFSDTLLDQEGVGFCCFCIVTVLPTFPYKGIRRRKCRNLEYYTAKKSSTK